MAATCFLCDRGHKRIPGTVPGDALGSCRNCSILACSAHAQRDPGYPRWVCVLCDTSLLAAAAISTSGTATLGSTLASLVSSALVREGARYESLGEFLEQRPSYRWLSDHVPAVIEEAPSRFTTNATESFWFGLPDEGRRFIAAAIILVEELELSDDDLVEALRILVHAWRSRN